MPSALLRHPLFGFFDIFKHGLTHPHKKRQSVKRLIEGSAVVNTKPRQTLHQWRWLKEWDRRLRQILSLFSGLHPPSVDATKQRPGFTSGWLPFTMASNVLLNIYFTGPASTDTQSLLTCLWICLKKQPEVISVIANYPYDFCRPGTLTSGNAGAGTKGSKVCCGVTARLRCGNIQ